MRFSSSLVVSCACVLAIQSVAGTALAKSSKYARPSSTSAGSSGSADTSATDASATGDASSGKAASAKATGAENAALGASTVGGANQEKKVDLTDLENRYWTAKDTEFNVVQNRLYTKAHRFSIEPMVGTAMSDPYNSIYNFGFAANYYFSERQGVELDYWSSTSSPSDTVNYFSGQFVGAQPDYNSPTGYVGASYNWVPIYAKLSLLEKKILYFDMSVSPGLGVTMLKSNVFSTTSTAPSQTNQSDVTFSLDVAQQVYIDEHWALRLDLKNHFYQETIYKASTGASLRNKFTYYGAIMLGVTYFFGTGARQQQAQ